MPHTFLSTEAVSEIRGAPDMYAQEGSDVTLLCRLKNYIELPTYLFWYHGDQMINYDANRQVSQCAEGNHNAIRTVVVVHLREERFSETHRKGQTQIPGM